MSAVSLIAHLSSSAQPPKKGVKRKRSDSLQGKEVQREEWSLLPNDLLAIVFHCLGKQETHRVSFAFVNWQGMVATPAVTKTLTRQPSTGRIFLGRDELTPFGDVGEEPPLPRNIYEMLEGPCPYWEGKKMKDTWVVVLIFATVDGRAHTLDKFSELMRRAKGEKTVAYHHYNPGRHGKTRIKKSYWVAITWRPIPRSGGISYAEQCQLLQPGDRPPKVREVATLLFGRNAARGEYLYGGNPFALTRCQETEGRNRVIMGGYTEFGATLNCDSDPNAEHRRLTAVRPLKADDS